jgi:23S rRNA (uracil1939-C5)-methyltransferase
MTAIQQGENNGTPAGRALRRGDRVTVTVEKLAYEGPGIGYAENGAGPDGSPRRLEIQIDGTVPGDLAEVEIFSVRHGEARGRVKKFLQYSERRVVPKCPHFGVKANSQNEPSIFLADGGLDLTSNCGGCAWQFLSYEDQLKTKEAVVHRALLQTGNVPADLLESSWKPIMAAENPWNYRNKMEFSIVPDREGTRRVGLHMRGRFKDVTEIRECHLFRPWVGAYLDHLRPFLETCQLGEEGLLKAFTIRAGTNSHEVMVNLQVENAVTEWTGQFRDLTLEFFHNSPLLTEDKLVSVFLTRIVNKKGQRTTAVEDLLWGSPSFNEYLNLAWGQLRFEVAPQAFLQPNTRQAERFYSLVSDLAALTGKERVFDLFCGTGTIGICLAERAGRVTGLELNAPAVENARRNAALNGISNIDFVVGDATKLLPEMGREVDLIVVDPPRAGLTPGIIETIAATAAPRLIYVSCNPFSLARDLKLLLNKGFVLKFAQAVDQFSQTYHVETVVLLER